MYKDKSILKQKNSITSDVMVFTVGTLPSISDIFLISAPHKNAGGHMP